MLFGEIIRRTVFNGMDRLKGGELTTLKTQNKKCWIDGVDETYIREKISDIILYAKKHCSYYASYPELKTLHDFPVLTKQDYKNNYDSILSDEKNHQGKIFELSTSGSTGTPFTVLCDKDKMNHINMNYIAALELNNFRFGMKRAEFRVVNSISKWKSFKNNVIRIDISTLNAERLDSICNMIERKQVQSLTFYPSTLDLFLDHIENNGINISRWKVESICTIGENCPNYLYEKIEKIFGFSPCVFYGNTENGVFAIYQKNDCVFEYNIDLFNYYIEVLKFESNEPVEPGDLGRIVITDYYNKTFPMIRYDTGDTGKMRLYKDSEGKIHGSFIEIYGRKVSMLFNCKGEPVSPFVFSHEIKAFETTIKQAQFVQLDKKKYEIILNVHQHEMDIETFENIIKKHLGDEADIMITFVDSIPIQASGKFMLCVQKCEEYL